jgi:acyl-coenzyme A synthetase/AMP-(fatty) acid ligase
VEFTTSFPRTTTGKVLKRELRAQLAEQDKAKEPRS